MSLENQRGILFLPGLGRESRPAVLRKFTRIERSVVVPTLNG